MADVLTKFAVLKFVGEVLTKPAVFAQHMAYTLKDEGEFVTGTFRASGPVAEFLKGVGNVEGTVEAGKLGQAPR